MTKRLIPWPFILGVIPAVVGFSIFFPGLMSWDSFILLGLGLNREINTWHPPLGGILFRLFSHLGPVQPIFLAFHFLILGMGLGLFSQAFSGLWVRQLGVFLLLFFPPLLGFAGSILKDPGHAFALILVWGSLLVSAKTKLNRRLLGVFLFGSFYAMEIRYFGFVPLLPAIWVFSKIHFPRYTGRAFILGLLGLFVADFGVQWATSREPPLIRHMGITFDLAGMTRVSGKWIIPDSLLDPAQKKFADQKGWLIEKSPRLFDSLFIEHTIGQFYRCDQFISEGVLRPCFDFRRGDALQAATWQYMKVVLSNPLAYMGHRFSYFRAHLGLDPLNRRVYPFDEAKEVSPYRLDYSRNSPLLWVHRGLKVLTESPQAAFLFVYWPYLLMSAVLLIVGMRQNNLWTTSLAASSLLCLAVLLFFSHSLAFRLGYWSIWACLLSILCVGQGKWRNLDARVSGNLAMSGKLMKPKS
ncbi:MAG: hypothetical protein JNL01_01005 [Bdellovibrionales bacterium]|nr:hypothetical protein [Bdellovibrionales bacterium]